VKSKVRKDIQSWLDEDKSKDDEWEEIGKKVEGKIKEEPRKWADKLAIQTKRLRNRQENPANRRPPVLFL